MKNTKTWSIILAVITVVSLILDTVSLEPFGLDTQLVGKISAILTILKLIYDNRALFNESDLVSFGNRVLEDDKDKDEQIQGSVTHADLENWKHFNR